MHNNNVEINHFFIYFKMATNDFFMVLASDLVNLQDEDLGSNMESDTEVNVSDFFAI